MRDVFDLAVYVDNSVERLVAFGSKREWVLKWINQKLEEHINELDQLRSVDFPRDFVTVDIRPQDVAATIERAGFECELWQKCFDRFGPDRARVNAEYQRLKALCEQTHKQT